MTVKKSDGISSRRKNVATAETASRAINHKPHSAASGGRSVQSSTSCSGPGHAQQLYWHSAGQTPAPTGSGTLLSDRSSTGVRSIEPKGRDKSHSGGGIISCHTAMPCADTWLPFAASTLCFLSKRVHRLLSRAPRHLPMKRGSKVTAVHIKSSNLSRPSAA